MRAILISSILFLLSVSCKNGMSTLKVAEKAKRAISTCTSVMESSGCTEKVEDADKVKDNDKTMETSTYLVISWDNKMTLW